MASKPKDGSLVINAPMQGIGPSPFLGFGDVRNLDIFTIPGVVRINNKLTKKSGTTVTGLILWEIKNPKNPTQVFGLDANGVVYKSTNSGNTWSVVTGNTAGGNGQGLGIWKDYLFVARAATLDVYGPLSGSPAWTNGWKTIDSDTLWHPMLVSKNDNKLYGGAGRFVFSVDENTGQTFDPANAATYTWTAQALDLPPDKRIKCLAEQGSNLMSGTWMGTNIYDVEEADIYPWDRSSPSFGEPLQLKEHGVHAMLGIGNILYVLAGIGGRVYSSNGAGISMIGQIPSSVADIEGGLFFEFYPGAIMHYKGRPFFGVSAGASNLISGMGIWSIMQTSKGNILNLEHTISTGSDGSASVVKIGALCGTSRDVFLAGWQDGANYGIDKVANTARYTGYTAYFDSPLYTVGSNLNQRQFSEIELQLAKPLASGEGVKVYYRTNQQDAFTLIGTYDFATLDAVLSHNEGADIESSELLQIRVGLTTGANSNSSPYFKSLTLR